MSNHPDKSEEKAQFLRRTAESRLGAGSAPTNSLPLDRDALTVLHEMAVNSSRSSDALKLLQELQVYQVELELQREELEKNERDMSRDLSWYKDLFALVPAACLVTTMEGQIVEANPAAVSILNTAQGDLKGQALQNLLKPESHSSWSELLSALEAGEQAASCEVLADGEGEGAVMLRLSANVFPGGDAVLLTLAST